MHYIIIKWNQDELRWMILHYTHDFDDFERFAMELYPESAGYVHMIDIKYVKSHDILERIAACKRRIANESSKT